MSGLPAKEARRALAECRPFSALSPSLTDSLFELMRARTYSAGETLIRQGDEPDCLLVLVDGAARIELSDEPAPRVQVDRVRAPVVVGEMGLVVRERRSAHVVAETDVSALVLPTADFERMAARHPQLAVLLTEIVADRLGASSRDGLGGKVVGGYTIARTLGKGGMAVVYEANRNDDGQPVALKMMSHRLIYQPSAFARFEREADILRRQRHENVVRLLDRFSAYNTQFIVMEHCDGPPLSAIIERHGPVAEERARPLIGQLARALRHVHGQKLIHRDVKPSNVLVTRRGVVKLADFGLARPDLTLEDPSVTRSQAYIGTPRYMSPEQFAGRDPDAKTDYYALACLGFELLAGAPLFTATSLAEAIRQKSDVVLPPAERIGGGVSEEMRRFLELGLAPRPEDRKVDLDALSDWAAPVDRALLDPAARHPGADAPTL